jgi:uncharacterized protein involved in exopolysaccharide biosynthesis
MGKNKHKFNFESIDFISYVWSKRKFLIVVSVLAAIISAIISLTITPKFRSTVLLYPASSSSVSKILLTDNNRPEDDALKFGSEEDGEQLMQVLGSSEIRDRIIRKFNLVKHYKIDTTSSKSWRSKLYGTISGNVSFHRTEYMSIVIDVLDTNPDTAAYIANEICNQIDTVMNNIKRARSLKALAIVEKEYKNMVNEMTQMQDSLTRLRELGVISYDQQTREYADAYASTLTKGNAHGAKLMEDKLKILAKYGGSYINMSQFLKEEAKRLSALKGRYMEVKVNAEETMPQKFIVDQAYKSEKKATPKRSLIVLVSTISAFFAALLLLIFRDSIVSKMEK